MAMRNGNGVPCGKFWSSCDHCGISWVGDETVIWVGTVHDVPNLEKIPTPQHKSAPGVAYEHRVRVLRSGYWRWERED